MPPLEAAMVALQAQIRTDASLTDKRSAARRTLRLEVPTSSSRDANGALIHNLSETGLLLETSAELQVGDALQVDLPHFGTTTAIVIWARGSFAGCEFATGVSKAAVSAALLRAPVQAAPPPAAIAREFWLHSTHHRGSPEELEDINQRVVIVSLLIALAVSAILVLALLTFPFSMS